MSQGLPELRDRCKKIINGVFKECAEKFDENLDRAHEDVKFTKWVNETLENLPTKGAYIENLQLISRNAVLMSQ